MQFHLALRRCLDSWKEQGRSRAQLAKDVGCSVAALSHWVNNRRPIEHHLAISLFQVLASKLTDANQKSALSDLASAYFDKFPDRSDQEISKLLGVLRTATQDLSPTAGPDFTTTPTQKPDNDVSGTASLVGGATHPTMPYFFAPFCLLLLIIFHTQVTSGVEKAWGQIWVGDQLSPFHLAIWSLLVFVAIFFFIGLEGKGAQNRAEWIRNGTWQHQYVSSVTKVLDTLDKWLLSKRRAQILNPTSFSRNWSIELYEKVLLFAILYPILAVMVQWFATGSEQAFGQLIVWPNDDVFLRRLLIFATFVGSVPIAFFARSRERKRWQVTICVAAIALNFVGYIACREFYDGVDVGPGAVNMAAIAFICGIGLRAFDNVAVPTAAASLAGATLSFAFLPILNVSELLTGKSGAGYDDADVRLVHTLLNHGLNIILFIGFIKILSKFINRESIEKKSYFGVTVYVSAAIGTAILMFFAATQGFWTEYYLFLGLIPLLNGIFDFFSIGLTRYTLRLGCQNFGLKTLFMSVADLFLAFFLFVVLMLFAVGVIVLLNYTSGGVIFAEPSNTPFCNATQFHDPQAALLETAGASLNDRGNCSESFVRRVLQQPMDYAWLIFIFASTLLPTVIHLWFALYAFGPALLSARVRTKIATWSLNGRNDLFQRAAAALAFGLWFAIVVVTIALVFERIIWAMFGLDGLLASLESVLGIFIFQG